MIMLDSKGGTPLSGRNETNNNEAVIEIPEEPLDDEEIRVENIPF
jgi:hypothetical protein